MTKHDEVSSTWTRFERTGALADLDRAINLAQQALATSPADTPRYPTILNNLGAMLSEVGRRDEALSVAAEAVAIRRRLAEENPASYEPNLASALNNLGNRLSEVGRQAEALAATKQAVAIYRRLAAASPAAYEPDLTASLSNLAGAYLAAGDLGRAIPL
ncbi:tetratricopeptide repeat protein [Streptomyces albidoflavus]|uniref:tetratricopeptide repeat protein n=1 Tax=Streptomyces albidoflavus TaxID=1886 RepID=UPI00331A9DE8